MTITRETITANGLDFSLLRAGDPAKPLLVFLHGFPEYSGAWTDMLQRFGEDFHCVAPDQRGYNLSAKPPAVEDYAGGKLAADAAGIIDRFGGKAHAVISHDWGASVGYALAFKRPDMVERLVVLNGVHPIPFQRELAKGEAQTANSQYITRLRFPKSHEKLLADDCALMRRFFAGDMDMSWMQGEVEAGYKAAWTQPGAMNAMVNWYRASPLIVPEPGVAIDPPDWPADQMRVRMPHLLVWGMADTALLPASREGLEDHCDDLTVVEIDDCDHWLIHQKPNEVEAAIRDFL